MGRSYLEMNHHVREARTEAHQHHTEAEKRTAEVKALRQTLADLMGDLDEQGRQVLLNRVRENGHDNHLINRLTGKM